MSDTDLFFRLSDDKLRRRALWAGAALSLSLLMPYEIIEDQPQFLWQLFGELPTSGVVAAVVEVLAGVTIIAARYLVKDAVAFAMTVLAAMFGAFVCNRVGTDASAWGLLPLPQSFASRATLALVAIAFTAAGTSVAHRAYLRRTSRLLIYGAIGIAAMFYLWPGRGRAPALLIYDHLCVVADLPGFRFQIGALTMAAVALWPALTTLSGLIYVRRPPASSMSLLPMATLFGFPLILMMMLFAWFARSNPGSALYAAMGAALEITAVLVLLSGALEVLAVEPERTPIARRAAALCSAALVVITASMWWVALPPEKGLRWEVGATKPAADVLFRDAVAGWSRARGRWHARVRRGVGAARARAELRERSVALVASARDIDPALAEALEEMVAVGERTEISSRAWYAAVGRVNEACRQSGLPYYLDPSVRVKRTKDGLSHHVSTTSFVVVRARRFEVDTEIFGTLHVRGLRGRSGEHRIGLLGLSRDVQPYALVAMEAAAEHTQTLTEMVQRNTPRCGRTFEEATDAIFARCGTLLSEMVATGGLHEAVVAKVERHELQHQIDGPLLPLATGVLAKLGGYADDAQERANRELSAFLAQLTARSSLVHVGLIDPLRFALLDDRGTYHHAAVLMFEALGRRSIRGPSGRVDAAHLSPVFAELADMSADTLRERAATAWEAAFGEELAPVELLDTSPDP